MTSSSSCLNNETQYDDNLGDNSTASSEFECLEKYSRNRYWRNLPLSVLTDTFGSEEKARFIKYGKRKDVLTPKEEALGYGRTVREKFPDFDDWKKLSDSAIVEKYGKSREEMKKCKDDFEKMWEESQVAHDWAKDFNRRIDDLNDTISEVRSDYEWLNKYY